MHVLYLHQYFCPPGGSGNNRSFELAQEWVKAGHEVTIVTSPAYFPEKIQNQCRLQNRSEYTFAGVQVIVLSVDYDHMMPFWKRILAWLRFYKKLISPQANLPVPDLIYASSTPLTVGEAGRKLSKRWGKPFVFETVDVWPDVPIGMGIVKNRVLIDWLNAKTNRIYTDSEAIVSLSEGMRDQVLSHNVAPEKVKVIHNGCNPEAFPFVERKQKSEQIEVLYTGTVGLANGLDQLVRVANRLEKEGRSDFRFSILGGGNDLARVKVVAAELGLKNIRFLERVAKEEVPSILAQADIGVVCFAPHKVLEANSANKFYDYLSSGLPVVTNYEGWQAAYLRDWQAGLSSAQGDEAAFAANLIRLADAPKERLEMGKRGRELVLKHFDRRKLAVELLQLFEEVISR